MDKIEPFWAEVNIKADGHYVPQRPWPQKFIVTSHQIMMDGVEVRPLTVTGIIKGVAMNFITMNRWRFLYLLKKGGFLDTPEGSYMEFFEDFRLDFWVVLRERRQARIDVFLEKWA